MDQGAIRSISSAPSVAGAAGAAQPAPMHDHVVQFYENDHFLDAAVGDFLVEGLAASQPILVVATPARRTALTQRLRAGGFEVNSDGCGNGVTMLDARDTLDCFMVGSVPDPVRFRERLGGVIQGCLQPNTTTGVRAFGEMVDILWKEGNTDGAIHLEELWNELAASHSFSLLCAYAMGNFYKEADSQHFHRVCQQHSRVIPTERYTQSGSVERMFEISVLQQRARALETEIEHRKDLERRLRETVTAHRAAEEALKQALERERSARADAEAATKAKSQFLTVMSHELRTPLNAIAGHVELVEMGVHGPLNDAQRDALLRVQRSQRHLLALINNVLNLARIETGNIEYSLGEVALVPLLADITSLVEPLFTAKHVQCEMVMPSEQPPDTPLAVRADAEKVRQIVINLLTNALKFTPSGGRVTVEAGHSPNAVSMACVRVSDTGIGIAPSKLDTIFEPFVQLSAPSGSQRDGVGLGLAISRDLARGMGGDVTVASVEGVGTTFMLSLPRI